MTKEELETEVDRLKDLLNEVADYGEVYVYPDDWDYRGMGGPPDIESYERVDLSDYRQ